MQQALEAGLSPLARGNPCQVLDTATTYGPIPARAGQPRSTASLAPPSRAYPRSRGATGLRRCSCCLLRGLSPLARGNLHALLGRDVVVGPIPARAGQPYQVASRSSWAGAYPRSRGATKMPQSEASATTGLSPLARGNRPRLAGQLDRFRPIPARAGQPLACNRLACKGEKQSQSNILRNSGNHGTAAYQPHSISFYQLTWDFAQAGDAHAADTIKVSPHHY